jgi:SAM-dependent methyltransferase
MASHPWWRDNLHPKLHDEIPQDRDTYSPVLSDNLVIERFHMKKFVEAVVRSSFGQCNVEPLKTGSVARDKNILEWTPGIYAKKLLCPERDDELNLFEFAEDESYGGEIVRGDLTTPGLAARLNLQSSFDIILCMQVFEHLRGCPFEAMKNLYAFVRPGGAVLWSAPHVSPLHNDPYDLWRYTPDGARLLAEKAGFEVFFIWAPGGVGMVGGAIFGIHADYWTDDELMMEHKRTHPVWPLQTYVLLVKPGNMTKGNQQCDGGASGVCDDEGESDISVGEGNLHSMMAAAGSDKAQHGFTWIYEVEFAQWRRRATHFAEVGVFRGASLLTWAKWFTHSERRIIGLDNFLGKMGWTFPDGSPLTWDQPLAVLKSQQYGDLPKGTSVVIVDQGNTEELAKVAAWLATSATENQHRQAPLDIIIDDGSHLMRDQQQTLAALWPLVSPGGLYVMEDVHTSKQSGYDVDTDAPNDWWTLLREYERTSSFSSSQYMSAEQASLITQWLAAIRCYILREGESETCVLQKAMSPKSPFAPIAAIKIINGAELGIPSNIIYG